MRVLIVTQDDPIYLPLFFNRFFEAVSSKSVEVEGVVIQRAFNQSLLGAIRKTGRLFGVRGILLFSAAYFLGRVQSRTGLPLPWPVSLKYECRRFGIEPRGVDDVNTAAFIGLVRDWEIDLVVSVSAAQIFKKEALEAAPLGVVNLHNGKLPEYKGMLPNFWQMFYGEAESVQTIHRMGEKIDEGVILSESVTPINGQTLHQLIRNTKERSAIQLAEFLEREELCAPKRDISNGVDPGYFGFPSKDDVATFKAKGFKTIGGSIP